MRLSDFISQDRLVQTLIDAILTLYVCLVLARVFISSNGNRSYWSLSFCLDMSSHIALIVFLSVTLQIIRSEHLDSKINLSTALATLCSSLISLIFGISLGRSWRKSDDKGNKRGKSQKNHDALQIQSKMLAMKPKSVNVDIADRSILDVADEAKYLLQTTLGIENASNSGANIKSVLNNSSNSTNSFMRDWKLSKTGYSSHIWLSTNKSIKNNNEFMIKGSGYSTLNTIQIVKYLHSNNKYFGCEGLMTLVETLQILQHGRIIINRLANTTSSTKIEYIVITTFVNLDNGGILIATKSLPSSYTSNHKRKGFHLNTILVSGYVILPVLKDQPQIQISNQYNENGSESNSSSYLIAKSRILFLTHMASSTATATSSSSLFNSFNDTNITSERIVNGTLQLLDYLHVYKQRMKPSPSPSAQLQQQQQQQMSHDEYEAYSDEAILQSSLKSAAINNKGRASNHGIETQNLSSIASTAANSLVQQIDTTAILDEILFNHPVEEYISVNVHQKIEMLEISQNVILHIICLYNSVNDIEDSRKNDNKPLLSNNSEDKRQGDSMCLDTLFPLTDSNIASSRNANKTSYKPRNNKHFFKGKELYEIDQLASYGNYNKSDINNNSSYQNLRNTHVYATENWNKFYEMEGITLSEYVMNGINCVNRENATETGGVLSAHCHIQASPNDVRNVLSKNPEKFDNLLERRAVLYRYTDPINPNITISVQWLAYSTIWPVGARDFLVLTVEYVSKVDDSFVIISTSIDEVCGEEERRINIGKHSQISSNGKNTSEQSHTYTRSTMKLAGYVGLYNKDTNGTDLTLFLDVDLYSIVPSWALHILATYGLTEMMNRIRYITEEEKSNVISDPICAVTSVTANAAIQRNRNRTSSGGAFEGKSGMDGGTIKVSSSEGDKSNYIAMLTNSNQIRNIFQISIEKYIFTKPDLILIGMKVAADSQLLLRHYEKFNNNQSDASVAQSTTSTTSTSAASPNGNIPLLDWQLKTKKNDIEVYTSVVQDTPWIALRATLVIPSVKKEYLKDFLMNDANLYSYDDMLDNIEPLLVVDDHTSIRRMTFKAIWPTAPRDFIICTTWNTYQNEEKSETADNSIIFVSSRSAWDDLYPIDSKQGYVRGHLYVSGYIIKEVFNANTNDIDCFITMCAHSDLGGTLPVGIINMLSSSAPIKMLNAISSLVRQQQ